MADEPERSSAARICLALTSCCCRNDDSDYQQHEARRAWARRFQHLIGSLQQQAHSKTQHPRDQVFDCILRLYAHQVRRMIARHTPMCTVWSDAWRQL